VHLFIPECNIQKVDALKTFTELEDAKTAAKTENVQTTVKPAQFRPDLKNVRNVKIIEMKLELAETIRPTLYAESKLVDTLPPKIIFEISTSVAI